MIVGCASGSLTYGLEGALFFLAVAGLMIIVVPTALGYALWKIVLTDRTGLGTTSILGLQENSATFTAASNYGISWRKLFLYGLTGIVFAFETFYYVVDLLSA